MKKALFGIGIAGSLVGALLVYRLISIPFGIQFDASVILLVASVVFTLVVAVVSLVRMHSLWIRLTGVAVVTISFLITIAVAVLVIDYRVFFFRSLPPSPSAEEWQQDVRYLADEMKAQHPGLFDKISESEFDKVVGDLESRIPLFTKNQITAGLFRIAALPIDGHTFPFVFSPCWNLRVLPFQTCVFDDGMYIVGVDREHREALGMKIVGIGGTPIDQVRQKIIPYVPADSEPNRAERFDLIASVAEVLEAEGIIEDTRAMSLTLEKPDGQLFDIRVRTVELTRLFLWMVFNRVDSSTPHQISIERDKNYALEYVAESRALRFTFNKVVDDIENDPFDDFLDRLDTALETTADLSSSTPKTATPSKC